MTTVGPVSEVFFFMKHWLCLVIYKRNTENTVILHAKRHTVFQLGLPLSWYLYSEPPSYFYTIIRMSLPTTHSSLSPAISMHHSFQVTWEKKIAKTSECWVVGRRWILFIFMHTKILIEGLSFSQSSKMPPGDFWWCCCCRTVFLC